MSAGFERGVLYIATGQQYRTEAAVSARSLKAVWPEITIGLIADEPVHDSCFDWIDVVGASISFSKVSLIVRSPFERTVFLDTDTYCIHPFPELFDLLDRFDLAASHEDGRFSTRIDPHTGQDVFLRAGDLPDSFPEFNTGVIAFHSRPDVLDVLRQWPAAYDAWRRTAIPSRHDQPSFRKIIYESDLRVAVLSSEYNFRLVCPGYARTAIKIIHGRWPNPELGQTPEEILRTAAATFNANQGPRVFVRNFGMICGSGPYTIPYDSPNIGRRLEYAPVPVEPAVRRRSLAKRLYATVRARLDRVIRASLRKAAEPATPTIADAPATVPAESLVVASQVRNAAGNLIYVDSLDERGRQLVRLGGNLNPPTVSIWNCLLGERRWTHVIDVGANYGEMLINGGLPSSARIVAVEPNARIRPYLERTLAEAGIAAEIVGVAVSDTVGSADLLVDRIWSGTTRLANPGESESPDQFDRVTVPTTTLAALLRSLGPQGDVRAVVKIDVEGHEVAALRGAIDALDELEAFAALVEVIHVPAHDLAWLNDHFDIEVYDRKACRLKPVLPATLERLTELLADERYYRNDVVLRRKGSATIGQRFWRAITRSLRGSPGSRRAWI
jgi:FkbM family methyltransferase